MTLHQGMSRETLLTRWSQWEGRIILLTWDEGYVRWCKLVKVYEPVLDRTGNTKLLGYIVGEGILNISPADVVNATTTV